MAAASAACDAIVALRGGMGREGPSERTREVRSLQEWHALARSLMAEQRA